MPSSLGVRTGKISPEESFRGVADLTATESGGWGLLLSVAPLMSVAAVD